MGTAAAATSTTQAAAPVGYLPAIILYQGSKPAAFKVTAGMQPTLRDCEEGLAPVVQSIVMQGHGLYSARGLCIPIAPAPDMAPQPAQENPADPLNNQAAQMTARGS
jgi:hypothetical protein